MKTGEDYIYTCTYWRYYTDIPAISQSYQLVVIRYFISIICRVVKKRVFYYCLFKTCFKRFFSFLIRFIRF